MKDYKSIALELMSKPVCSQAAKKRILEALNKAYEQIREKIVMEYRNSDSISFWDLPLNLHQFTNKKLELFKGSDFINEVKELVVLRTDAKAIDVTKKVKEVTIFDEIKNQIKSSALEHEKIEVTALTKLLEKNGLKVCAIWHYVQLDNGTVFVRWFWYLNDSITAYSDIVKAVQKVIK